MIYLGKLEDTREKIDHLRALLLMLGEQGSFTIDCPAGKKLLEIKPDLQLEIVAPFTFDYKIKGEQISILFRQPYPIAHAILTKRIKSVGITTERISISIDWSPDGYLEVVS